MTTYALVGDIGGTNARLALCDVDTGQLSAVEFYPCAHYESLEIVIRQYLKQQNCEVKYGSIAIACPVTDDVISMTNHSWRFSVSQMKASLGWERFEVINDFTAVSLAIPVLGTDDAIQIGGKQPQTKRPIAVYGAGTGLGVAHLVHTGSQWMSLPGEGGHVEFAPDSAEEDHMLSVLREEYGHVSAERVLSGPGLVNIYRSLMKLNGQVAEDLTPREVSDRALNGNCSICKQALELFCTALGRFGGNLALNMGAFGGVYIAGGIVPRFFDFFQKSGFRQGFENKGRFTDYLKDIPVYLITHDNPGLLGAGSYIRQLLGKAIG
ncbi:glucokinase [Xenorhabdus griffiniae]|uniref:Glucokinase n=1 Tax=Xenorhabdus griffiniae TaxID=351672 RepID=A0ABY9XJR3_9GAMM|nr:glucokinase [Xenorhabdus griffiniae]MBD1227127.1 glucokinase [Xenorhabdus griffiniae]MBE8586509.1 glucokinase [Xenorhabdus griffiniae]WMV73126.1 glucokinase [Xenorhabdus griffiniae]WNH02805.1 glucokinase [Xenorhabdus griffiniae]